MKLVAALLLISSAAHADVVGTVAAGAGGDSSTPGGFATAHAEVDAELAHAAPPLDHRGVYFAPTADSPLGVWLFTGLDATDRDGLGATADATVIAGAADRALLFDGRAWARGAGWQLTGGATVQPLGSLHDRFARSGRGVTDTSVGVDIPAWWAIGSLQRQFLAGLMTVDLGTRDKDGHTDGFDRAIDFTFMRVQTPRLTLDAIGARYHEFGAAQIVHDGVTYGTSAIGFDLDAASLTYRPRAALAITAHAGVTSLMPVAPFSEANGSSTSSGVEADVPSYWLEVREGVAADPVTGERAHAIVVGGGSWARFDPTGNAVDVGQLGSAAIDERIGRADVHAGVELGRLQRVLIGNLAPATIAPVGTRVVMGRGSLAATLPVSRRVQLAATAWVERSDRDDPRWAVPATGELATHAGADVTASWRFRTHARR